MIHSDFKSSALLTSTFAVLSINTTWISSRGTHTGSWDLSTGTDIVSTGKF